MTVDYATLRNLCHRYIPIPGIPKWDVYNIPNNPLTCPPEEFLTVGIEKNDDYGCFESDEEAYDYVNSHQGDLCQMAIQIHDLADALRMEKWGDKDRRTPPEPEVKTDLLDIIIQVQCPNGLWVHLDPSPFEDMRELALANHISGMTGLRTTVTTQSKTTVTP